MDRLEFEVKYGNLTRKGTFTNELGEEFIVYITPTGAAICSTETNNLVVPLFNPNLSIWSLPELAKLGKVVSETSSAFMEELEEKTKEQLKEEGK